MAVLESGKLTLLKSELRRGCLEGLTTFLESEATAADLKTIREQKLLLIPSELQIQATAARAYALAASRLSNDDCVARARNYAEFTVFCAQTFRKISHGIAGQFVQLKRLCKHEILALAEDVLDESARGMENGQSVAFGSHAHGKPGEQSEMSEYLLHEFNGLNNDLYWAVFRGFNEVMKLAPDVKRERLTRREWEEAKKEFLAVTFRALAWNNWQYVLDKVTYGEWHVAEISSSEASREAQGRPPIRGREFDRGGCGSGQNLEWRRIRSRR